MGPLSSLFDFLTFGVLVFVFNSSPAEFRTTWFLESMATQILVIFIIRANGRPWQDLPRPALAASSLVALIVAMVLPFTPVGGWFGFAGPAPSSSSLWCQPNFSSRSLCAIGIDQHNRTPVIDRLAHESIRTREFAKIARFCGMSVLPATTDIVRPLRHVRVVL